MVKQVILSGCGIKFNARALRKADIDVSIIALAGSAHQTVEQPCGGDPEDKPLTITPTLLTPPGEGHSRKDMIRKRTGKDAEAQIRSQEQDALADSHDELGSKLAGYWLLEWLLPATFTWQAADGKEEFESKYGLTNTTLDPHELSLTYIETHS